MLAAIAVLPEFLLLVLFLPLPVFLRLRGCSCGCMFLLIAADVANECRPRSAEAETNMDYQTISGLQPNKHTHTHTHVAVRILLLKNTTSVGITTATTIIIITLTTAVAVAATKDIKRNAKELLTKKAPEFPKTPNS